MLRIIRNILLFTPLLIAEFNILIIKYVLYFHLTVDATIY